MKVKGTVSRLVAGQNDRKPLVFIVPEDPQAVHQVPEKNRRGSGEVAVEVNHLDEYELGEAIEILVGAPDLRGSSPTSWPPRALDPVTPVVPAPAAPAPAGGAPDQGSDPATRMPST